MVICQSVKIRESIRVTILLKERKAKHGSTVSKTLKRKKKPGMVANTLNPNSGDRGGGGMGLGCGCGCGWGRLPMSFRPA